MTRPRPWCALALALALVAPAAGAQAPAEGVVLPFDAYRAQVRANHPVARPPPSTTQAARADQQAARGGFDPALAASWDRKTFDGKTYYDYAAAKLVAPTPLGVDVVLGWERAVGAYASADRRTPAAGLVTAGVSIPVGQRMLTDERRTALAVAGALRAAADAERDAALLRLGLQVARDYARWYEGWRREAIAVEGVELAAFRLDAVRRRLRAGEAAAIDTIEAALELRRRRVTREKAAQAHYAARLVAESHLWTARGDPEALPADAIPAAPRAEPVAGDTADAARLAEAAARAHPDVRRASERADAALAQRRLAAQGLLPAVELQASALAARDDGLPGAYGAAADDAKVGATVKLPLLWLRERGRLGAASAREEQQRLDAVRARREIAVQVRAASNDVATLDRLLAEQRTAVALARALRDGEQRRFDAGESTLFLVNARERVVLEEQLELAALEARRLVAASELEAALGGPPG